MPAAHPHVDGGMTGPGNGHRAGCPLHEGRILGHQHGVDHVDDAVGLADICSADACLATLASMIQSLPSWSATVRAHPARS